MGILKQIAEALGRAIDPNDVVRLTDSEASKLPFEMRDAIGQHNAMKMLGLPEGNTAQDRLKILAPYKGYHGSTHSFGEFGGNTKSQEGFMGTADYMTTSPLDASANYAGVGPDLTSRIERMAETMYEDMDEEDAYVAATKLLKGDNEGVVYPIRMGGELLDISPNASSKYMFDAAPNYPQPDNYFDAAKRELILDNPDVDEDEIWDRAFEMSDEAMYDWEPEGPLVKLQESLRAQADKYDFDPSDMDEDFALYYSQGGSPYNIVKDIRKITSDAMDYDTGNMVSGDIVRQSLMDAGYPLTRVDARREFPTMANIPEGTKHYMSSDPTKIRSIFAVGDPARFGVSKDILAGAAPVGFTAAISGGEDE